MAYLKQTWVDAPSTDSPISAERLNHIETGIDDAHTLATAKYTKPGAGIPTGDLSTAVQSALANANSALQSAPVTSVAGRDGAVVLQRADITDSGAVGRTLLGSQTVSQARATLNVAGRPGAELNHWRAAVGLRGTRNPRILIVGDSASSERYSWQHQLAGRMWFDPQRADEPAGYLDVAFANGLLDAQISRFNDVAHLTDIDVLFAPDSAQMGQWRYDEGSWQGPWVPGSVWSNGWPETGLIDYQRIADMGGAADLSVRPNGGSGETYWYGFNAKVSDAKLDVMSLAQPDVTAKWWVDRLTGGTTAVEDWGNAIPRALADGFDPDLVIIALGANDLDDPIIIDDVAVNLSTVVTEMRDICPNADVALQTYWQPTWSTVRDQVLAVADTAGTALLDFWPQIPPFSEHPALYADEFHLNAAGHQVLADLAVDALGIPVS